MLSNQEDDPVSKLQSQVQSLRKRVEELEEENARLSSRLSGCRCREGVSRSEDISGNVVEMKGEIKADDKKTRKTKGGSMRDLMHCPKRYVALRVTYFGQRFYGFASEAQQEPTVESELFKALEKTRLSVGDKRQAHYSRCGRTDKGVSSVGQVIALLLRSYLRDNSMTDDEGEIDYVVALNRALPEDIRVTGWCPVPSDFSARFSCLSREYKYFFWRNNLDTVSMKMACDKLVGEHDFRNFCKMDAVNVHNYRRRIMSFTLCPCDTSYKGYELWAFEIKGSAFLWHQVRCMVAVLFMIGQGIESPDVIDALLDTEQMPRKPQYIMAPEVPLVLQSCEFEGLNFRCSSDAWKTLYLHLENVARDFELQAAICSEALLKILPKDHVMADWTSLSAGTARKPPSHIPLMRRSTEPSYDERRAKFKSKQGKLYEVWKLFCQATLSRNERQPFQAFSSSLGRLNDCTLGSTITRNQVGAIHSTGNNGRPLVSSGDATGKDV